MSALLQQLLQKETQMAVIGCGYVGLSLALGFGRKIRVVGFDIDRRRIRELQEAEDVCGQFGKEDCRTADVRFTDDPEELRACKVFVIAVPTPVDLRKLPDKEPLRSAVRLAGKFLVKGGCVIVESTVNPFCTREECIPLLEQQSGLMAGKDFLVGYSPERVNPGDRLHSLEKVRKIVSGFDTESRIFLEELYSLVVEAPLHVAETMEIAEGAKLAENIQRDVNIALMNELSMGFDRLGVPFDAVLKAAETKWNFTRFYPGLVGGHCIAVDPYYFLEKLKEKGFASPLVEGARAVNESMADYYVGKIVSLFPDGVAGKRILLKGLAFKEGVRDMRNTKVPEIKMKLESRGAWVDVFDPQVDPATCRKRYGFDPVTRPDGDAYDLVLSAYSLFRELGC